MALDAFAPFRDPNRRSEFREVPPAFAPIAVLSTQLTPARKMRMLHRSVIACQFWSITRDSSRSALGLSTRPQGGYRGSLGVSVAYKSRHFSLDRFLYLRHSLQYIAKAPQCPTAINVFRNAAARFDLRLRYLSRVGEALADVRTSKKSRRRLRSTQGRVGCSPNDPSHLNFSGDCHVVIMWTIVAIQC